MMTTPSSNSIFKVARSVEEERGLGEINLSFFIHRWVNRYPIDKAWREKRGISFNSPEHRNTYVFSLISDMLINAFILKYIKEASKKQDKYNGGRGEYLKHRENSMTDADIQETFDKIDIDNLQYDEDGNLLI